MTSWTNEDMYIILSMYPKDTTSVLLQCEYLRKNFTIDYWDIENCEFRLSRGTMLTEDIIMFIGMNHDDLKIKIVELCYAKEDACAIVHLNIEQKTIINYYKPIGPTLAQLEAAGISVNEYKTEKLKL
jgi:hypothetical protein